MSVVSFALAVVFIIWETDFENVWEPCIEKCEKYRQLKYVKTSIDKKQASKN